MAVCVIEQELLAIGFLHCVNVDVGILSFVFDLDPMTFTQSYCLTDRHDRNYIYHVASRVHGQKQDVLA